ncbi:hypothetical protein M3J09_008630 [Ascochyta lentis]
MRDLISIRYASQAAYDSHIASRSSEDLLALLAKTTLLASPPDSLSFHVTSSYSRQETTKAKDPYILIASFEYKEDSREAALAGWQNVTSACQHSEEGTFAYVVGKDTKNAQRRKILSNARSCCHFRLLSFFGHYMISIPLWHPSLLMFDIANSQRRVLLPAQ